MNKIQIAFASLLTAGVLAAAVPSSAAPFYDASANVGYVAVTQGSSSEVMVKLPVGLEQAAALRLVGVDGQAGLRAEVLEAKLVDAGNGQRQWQVKLKVSHEFFNGAAFGSSYPVGLTFDTNGAHRTVFVTVAVK